MGSVGLLFFGLGEPLLPAFIREQRSVFIIFDESPCGLFDNL
jgi:hypothetical protein